MKKYISFLILAVWLFSCIRGFSAAPSVSAQSAVILDAASGRVLYNKNMEKRSGMASTTKIMTAITALEYGNLEDTVKVSSTAAGVEGSSMYLSAGEEITLENLLYGLMLVSGNDAATAVAEHVGGSVEKFAAMMNDKAKQIGAMNTHFDNPHGLATDTHYTTAKDLAMITAYGLKNEKFAEIVATKSKKVPWQGKSYQRQLNNHNKLLAMYDGCIGVKTGFTKATGRCLVSAVKRGGMTLICVTLNAPNDWDDHMKLYEDAFSCYSAEPLLAAGQEIGEVDVKGGTENSVKAVMPSDCYFPVTEEEKGKINIIHELNSSLEAPVRTGQTVGKAGVELNGERFLCYPIVSDLDVQRRSIVFRERTLDLKGNMQKVFYLWLTVFQNSGENL